MFEVVVGDVAGAGVMTDGVCDNLYYFFCVHGDQFCLLFEWGVISVLDADGDDVGEDGPLDYFVGEVDGFGEEEVYVHKYSKKVVLSPLEFHV